MLGSEQTGARGCCQPRRQTPESLCLPSALSSRLLHYCLLLAVESLESLEPEESLSLVVSARFLLFLLMLLLLLLLLPRRRRLLPLLLLLLSLRVDVSPGRMPRHSCPQSIRSPYNRLSFADSNFTTPRYSVSSPRCDCGRSLRDPLYLVQRHAPVPPAPPHACPTPAPRRQPPPLLRGPRGGFLHRKPDKRAPKPRRVTLAADSS